MPEAPTPTRSGTWFDTSDHRRIGLLFVYCSLLFLLIAGLAGAALRGELAEPASQLLGDEYGRAFSMHATLAVLLFLVPAWLGLATAVVPLQIGANRVAFPRAQALSLWLFVCGGIVTLVSYVLDGFSIGGITLATPPGTIEGGGPAANDLWIAGVALVSVAALIASITLVVTVATLRAPGMRFSRTPLFSWSVLVTGIATALSTPVLLGGLALLYVDQHFGGQFFASEGGPVAWQHTVWLFGRPDVFLLLLPGLGVACDVVASSARRPLIGTPAAHLDIAAFGVLAFTAFATGPSSAFSLTVPTANLGTALIVLPLLGLGLVWAATIVKGRLRTAPAQLFVLAAIALIGLAALNVAIAALVGVTGSAWTNGFLHLAVFGPPVLLLGAGLAHWAPQLWGRALPAGASAITALLLFGGFVVMGGASLLLGYNGLPWHTVDPAGASGAWANLHRLAAAGGVLIVLGALSLAGLVLQAAGKGQDETLVPDPDAMTLEWSASAPAAGLPNFETVPPVRSEAPLAELDTPALEAELQTSSGGAA